MRLRVFISVALVTVLVAAVATAPGASRADRGPATLPPRAGASAVVRLPSPARIVLIVFENHSYGQVIGSASAPTFNRLARAQALLTRYYAVAHPSLPNYLALVSGSTHGVTTDCPTCVVRAPNLVDELDAAGKSWKVYAEGIPSPGFAGPRAGRYTRTHNPFLYFADVNASLRRRQRIVGLGALRADLLSRRLPAFSLVVPDLCHDMHDCPVSTGDAWLRAVLPSLLAPSHLGRGVVFIVFDESLTTDRAGGGGHVPALVLGPLVRPGARSSAVFTHYSLLRTIEDVWRLRRLGRSASASPITGIWR